MLDIRRTGTSGISRDPVIQALLDIYTGPLEKFLLPQENREAPTGDRLVSEVVVAERPRIHWLPMRNSRQNVLVEVWGRRTFLREIECTLCVKVLEEIR